MACGTKHTLTSTTLRPTKSDLKKKKDCIYPRHLIRLRSTFKWERRVWSWAEQTQYNYLTHLHYSCSDRPLSLFKGVHWVLLSLPLSHRSVPLGRWDWALLRRSCTRLWGVQGLSKTSVKKKHVLGGLSKGLEQCTLRNHQPGISQEQ